MLLYLLDFFLDRIGQSWPFGLSAKEKDTMTINRISPALLDKTPKEVLAVIYAATAELGIASGNTLDAKILNEWRMQYERGNLTIEPPK